MSIFLTILRFCTDLNENQIFLENGLKTQEFACTLHRQPFCIIKSTDAHVNFRLNRALSLWVKL